MIFVLKMLTGLVFISTNLRMLKVKRVPPGLAWLSREHGKEVGMVVAGVLIGLLSFTVTIENMDG